MKKDKPTFKNLNEMSPEAREKFDNRYKRLINTLRAGRVMRWHTTPDGLRQTVGEHTFGVMCILAFVLDASGMIHAPDEFLRVKYRAEAAALLLAALLHDAPELYTGDIPAPTRDEIAYDAGFSIAEDRASQKVLDCKVTETNSRIIFYADKIEAMLFALKSQRHEAFEYNRNLLFNALDNDDTTPAAILDVFKHIVAPYGHLGF